MSFRLPKTIVAVVATLALALPSGAETIARLESELVNAHALDDSISILYHLLDLSPYADQGKALERLYNAVIRSNDDKAVLDILRMQSNYYSSNDSIQEILLQRASQLPESDDRRCTELFIRINTMMKQVRALSAEERQQKLLEYISHYRSVDDLDIYQQIEYLFHLCSYLRNTTEGDLLIKYVQELQSLIDQLPSDDLSLRSLFYTQAALCYVNNGMHQHSVDANKMLLDLIEALEARYAAAGRTYRNYDRSRYICYRRLLRSHAVLPPEEVNQYYNAVLQLADRNDEIRKDLETRKRPTIYYLMARHDYKEAIPLIVEQLQDSNNSRDEHRYLVEALIEAADNVGDDKNLLYALRLDDKMLREYIHSKATESYKELQIIYEVNDLKHANDDLVAASQDQSDRSQRILLIITLAGLSLILIILAITYFMYRRARKISHRYSQLYDDLLEERDVLKATEAKLITARDEAKQAERIKSDFVNNMSHEIRTPLAAITEYSNLIADIASDAEKPYVKHFADIVSLNTDLVTRLVNDVLELPTYEDRTINIDIHLCSVQTMCHLAIDTTAKRVNPRVKVIFANDGQDDSIIRTDSHRVEQVLINLLVNAAKFTEAGTITLAYNIDPDQTKITFTVTDTGIGIPVGREEDIFRSFFQLDPSVQGNGLGLYISRLVAERLGGALSLDTSYTTGARFVFVIPLT